MAKLIKTGFSIAENSLVPTVSRGYFYIFNSSNQVWQTTTLTFVTWVQANFANYRISGTVQHGTVTGTQKRGIFFQADFPSDITTAGNYALVWETNVDIAAPTRPVWGFGAKQIIKWNGTDFEPPNEDVYHADIHLLFDTSNDEYTVTWFKNGVRLTTGITSPEITVVDSSGLDLITSASMTQIGTTGSYKYDEGSNRISQAGIDTHTLTVSAMIDSLTRNYTKIIANSESFITG